MTVDLNKVNVKIRSMDERLIEKSRKLKAAESQRDYFKKKFGDLKAEADIVNVFVILISFNLWGHYTKQYEDLQNIYYICFLNSWRFY